MTFKISGQVDTLNYEPHETEVACDGKGKKCKYFVDKKPATKSEYDKAQAQSDNLNSCKPCWLKYKDKSGQLVYEGDFYTDCCIGFYVERYSSGKLKLKGQYKTPVAKIPDYNAGDCRRHGSWTYYKLNGDVEKTEVYKDGELIK
ncbi:MAG TPA: hypothetical protein VN026_06555 [Bacteroidia bacterium]|nr:hypothetical protein [Bacteroidia bacterium]